MPDKKIGPGFSKKNKGKVVTFSQKTTVELGRNRRGGPILALFPEGTVGILTGGFINGIDRINKPCTKWDVKVTLSRRHGRFLLIVSVPREALQSETKLEID